jgi:hypothetical protein
VKFKVEKEREKKESVVGAKSNNFLRHKPHKG